MAGVVGYVIVKTVPCEMFPISIAKPEIQRIVSIGYFIRIVYIKEEGGGGAGGLAYHS